MKYFNSVLIVSLLAFFIHSCTQDDSCVNVICEEGHICVEGSCVTDPDYNPDANTIVVNGFITENTTWSADKIWELSGKVVVSNSAVLMIEPGTIIKGRTGDGTDASALIIARNAKIMADGTKDSPIIFTSVLDNIEIGGKSGTNLDETDQSKWGGVIILGNAKVSVKVGDEEGQIEGIPADEEYGKYGGNDDTDNSGMISYVSIRYGGVLIGEGNEINGLTLGGVGSGTVIKNVEVVANLDDGIEFFGGAVSVENALVAYSGDDGFDIDQNYSGTIRNSVVVHNNSGDKILEIDGPENNTNKSGKFTFEYCSFFSKTEDGTIDLKSKAQGRIANCKFNGLTKFELSAKFEDDCVSREIDAYDNYLSGDILIFDNNTPASIAVYTKSVDPNDLSCPITSEVLKAATDIYNASNNATSALGADISAFSDWTWSSINNKL